MAALLLTALMMASIPMDDVEGREVTLDDDEYYVSVDPDDPDQGVVSISGEIDPGDIGILDTVTVSLSVAIHELLDGAPTGRTWYGEVSYDDSTIGGSSNVFRRGDSPESFTISTDPATYDPARTDSIPIPPGLSDRCEGRVVLTASFAGGQDGEDTIQASIYPELYHLINLSTPDDPVEMEAGDRLIYSLNLKNSGNMVDSINVEVPVLDQLDELGFTTELQNDHFDDVQPGETVVSNMSIKAPLEIKRNDSYDIIISAYTDSEDPVTLEAASSRIIMIDLKLIRSKIDQTVPTDDDDDDPDDDEPYVPVPGQDPMTTDDEAEPWMVVVAIGFVIVIIVIVAIVLFKKGGGGDDDDQEIDQAHQSMVRI